MALWGLEIKRIFTPHDFAVAQLWIFVSTIASDLIWFVPGLVKREQTLLCFGRARLLFAQSGFKVVIPAKQERFCFLIALLYGQTFAERTTTWFARSGMRAPATGQAGRTFVTT